ncbi:hypothetical protein ABT235_01845 [Micromonospora echinofusca]|uniref:hypothetical protein n=1 Tax=Micromonospora echinofusca TaxID=47858 RepID=UPI003333032A
MKRWLAGTLSVLMATAGLVAGVGATAASAGTGLFYQVVDADNDPYAGIYLRNSTRMDDVNRVWYRYMLYGTTIELMCGTWGEAVGPYANRRWHQVYVPGGDARGQTGWVADRYLNTPNRANEPTPHEPECGAPPPPPPPPAPVGLYAHPKDDPGDTTYRFRYTSVATRYAYLSNWSAGECDSAGAYSRIRSFTANKPIGWMASWSRSRYAPLYFLHKASLEERRQLDYILLIDPGNYSDMATCGNGSGDGTAGTQFDAGRVLARWLNDNPDARLVVIDGDYTRGDGSSGIQNVLFNDVRNHAGSARGRVGVCEYSLAHEPDSFRSSEWYIERPITDSCPRLENNNYPLHGMWHP